MEVLLQYGTILTYILAYTMKVRNYYKFTTGTNISFRSILAKYLLFGPRRKYSILKMTFGVRHVRANTILQNPCFY